MNAIGQTLALFRSRDYALLWAIQFGSGLAMWLRILGTAQWLLESTGSAVMVGLIGVVQLFVQVPALLWGGTLADRVNRKWLILGAWGLTAAAMGGLALLSGAEALTALIVYVGIALTGATQTFANPARAALVAVVVEERDLMRATSVDTATANAAAVLGPLLFATLSLASGLTAAFAVAASLAMIAALLPLFVRAEGRVKQEEQRGSTVQQTADGLRYVARHPILPGLFMLDTGITVVSFYREILPVLALGMFAAGAEATGFLGAANSTGAIIGSFVALAFAGWRAKGMLVLYASLFYAVMLLGFGLSSSLWMGLLFIALLGAADSVTVAVRTATVLMTTPDEMRGRAYSIMVLAAYVANNLGTIWIGFWAAAIGAAESMVLGAALAAVATLAVGWLWKPIRTYRSA